LPSCRPPCAGIETPSALEILTSSSTLGQWKIARPAELHLEDRALRIHFIKAEAVHHFKHTFR